MQSLIQYVIDGCQTPALPCDSRDGDNMDSRDVLETDHGHRDYTTVDLRTDDAGSACSNSKPRHDRK